MKHFTSLAAVFLLSAPLPLAAQVSALPDRPMFETRAELQAEVTAAEARGKVVEAGLMRARLQSGDFQSGDRIAVQIDGGAPFADTLVVGPSRELAFPQMGEVSLSGVLRAELVPLLQKHISTYLRDATLRAKPLMRLAVLGNVARPGFYYFSAEMPLSDVLMGAGGPSADANLANIRVRRGAVTILPRDATRAAMQNGISVDRLHLRAGDEIQVGKKQNRDLTALLSVAGGILGLAAAAAAIAR